MTAKSDVSYVLANASSSYSLLRAEASHNKITSVASYQDITAVEVRLDPDTLNRFFRGDTFSFADVLTFVYVRDFENAYGLSDAVSLTSGKAIADSLSFGDTATVFLLIQRSFADSIGLTDTAVLSNTLGKTDTLQMLEQLAFEQDIALNTDIAFTDSAFLQLLIPRDFSDNVSLTDIFVRDVVYSRVVTDAFSVNDSFNLNLILGNNSVLNASALNTYTLNR